MRLDGRKILLGCGIISAAIALYHVGFFAFGMGEAYDPRLPAHTLAVAALFGVFAAYGLSGAGVIRRLPWLKFGLAIPATIYTLYGTGLLLQRMGIIASPAALDWTNIVVGSILGTGALTLGIAHFVGMRTARAPIN